MAEDKVKVVTEDGTEVQVPRNQLRMFGMISTMIGTLNEEEEGDTTTAIPLPKVPAHVLKLILQWTERHAEDPETSDDEESQDRRVDDVPQWDLDFIKRLIREDGSPGGDLTKLYDLMQACNYLDVRLLLTYCSKIVARRMKDLTVEEVREQFGIENDYTEEEEEQLKRENAWAEIDRNA